jgi:hypothetical protein
MSHMKQIGGTREVKGTSISKKLRELALTAVGTTALLYYVYNNWATLKDHFNIASKPIRNMLCGILNQAGAVQTLRGGSA